MNKTSLAGLVVTGVGIVFLILGNTNFEKREEVLRIGDFRASATVPKNYPALRYIGVGCLGAGVVLIVLGFKQKGI